MSEDVMEIQLSESQFNLKAVNANVTYALWPRGSGKTTAIGDRVEHLSEVMPKSQLLLFSDTFKRLEDRIVPNMLNYLINSIGLIEGEDFVTFKTPPEDWDKPIIPLKKFDHVISFASGMALCLASQAVPGSANAYNAQAMIVDEAKYTKEEIINTEALPALRGAFDLYGHLPEYRSHWYFTDKYGANIKWLLAKKRLCNKKQVDAIINIHREILRLQNKLMTCSSSRTKAHYNGIIEQYEQMINKIRIEMVYYSDAPPYENIKHLGEKYFRDLKRDLSYYEYSISVENQDPYKAEHSFYPTLSNVRNYHNIEHDADKSQPLMMALDYNWRITPMVVAQFGKLPGKAHTTLNIVNAIHTLHPNGGIEATINKFCDYYATHGNKTVYYIHDHTAIGKRPDGLSFADIVRKILTERGWQYIDVYMGQAPFHNIKHEQFKTMFENDGEMAVMINEYQCQPLITSVEGAAAKTTLGKVTKDKSQEKNLSMAAEEQTDYSDAMDQLLWATLMMNLVTPVESFHAAITSR